MAVSRHRITSISELRLPQRFLKERPFETTSGKQLRTRQETQDDSDTKCGSSEYKLSKFALEMDLCKAQGKEDFYENWSQLGEVGHLADKFAPHIMALEQFQQKMRMFLQEKAQSKVQQPKAEEISEQERQLYFDMFMAIFRDRILIKIKDLFRLSLFYEVCLRRIQCVGDKDLEPLRKAILETEEIIQTFLQVLSTDREYTLETQFNHEALNISLIESKLKLEKLFEESVFFQGQLPTEDKIRYTATESRVSFALGLKIDFLDQLKLFDDELRSHWSLEEWILNFLTNNYEDIDDEELKKDLSKDLLIELGFRDNSQAIGTILERSALSEGHVEPIELVKRFVKDELKYHPVFAQELYRFPYTDEACVQCEINVADKMISVMHMNIGRVEDMDELYDQYISKHIHELRDGESVLLFHGTDHCSAIDILNRGIDINLGMPKHDFTDGYGFYLGNDYKYSETWSQSQTRKPAVLVFKVPKTFLSKLNTLDLAGEDKRDEWLQIVSENRSGRPSKKLRNKMKHYDIVRGPLARKRSDGASESPVYEPREDMHQVCILNEDCADELQEYLNTAIFYE